MKKVIKSDKEWQKQLSPETFRVTRQKGTERPFTGHYHDCHKEGVYRCVCCGNPLFTSEVKYESGSGWPSFWKPLDSEAIEEHTDRSLGMVRREIVCSRCEAHLGHVFEDGPEPTGLRYCVNSASLDLDESQQGEQ